MTYGKRLNEALTHAGKTRKQLAAHLGCTPQIIGMVISGAGRIERKLSTDNHARAASFLGVRADWLLSGDGEMLATTGTTDITPPPPSVTASATNQALAPWLTEQCRSIMAMLATLPDDPVIRYQVLGQLAEIVARARGSPSSHQEPPAYQSQAATRAG